MSTILNENDNKKKELINILSELDYTYDETKNDILDKLYNLYKNNIIDEECTDDDYITYKAYYYYTIIKDNKLTKQFYKQAIEMGNTHAMHGLSMYYKRLNKNNKMLKYLKMAIKKNDSSCMIDYANYILFDHNKINTAMKYYNMAKKNNYYRGYYELAYYFYEYKFNYQKAKENMLLFLDTFENDIESYLDSYKMRDILLEKLITMILIHEYEDNIDFLIPYFEKFNIKMNMTEACNKYKIKMQSKKQFLINKQKFETNGECGICYEDKKLHLFDCIGHSLCDDCYNKVDKCPFCSITKHPLMIKNRNARIDISIDNITEEAISDLVSEYESNSEVSDGDIEYDNQTGFFGTYIPPSDDEENAGDHDDEENDGEEEQIENINQDEIVHDEGEYADGGHIYTPPNEYNDND
jgi:hypothetical protein